MTGVSCTIQDDLEKHAADRCFEVVYQTGSLAEDDTARARIAIIAACRVIGMAGAFLSRSHSGALPVDDEQRKLFILSAIDTLRDAMAAVPS